MKTGARRAEPALIPTVLAAFALCAVLPGRAAESGNAPASERKSVLIIESFGRDLAPWNTMLPALKRELAQRTPHPIEFHETYWGAGREDTSGAEQAFASYLRALYSGRPPDLVIPVGVTASQLWWRLREAVFPSAPVVIGGIEHRMLARLPCGPRDTAVTIDIDIARDGFDPIFQLFPATTHLLMVIGDSPIEQFWNAQCQRAWDQYGKQARLSSWHRLSFPEIRRRAAELPPHSALAYWAFWVDAAGVPHEGMKALQQLAAVASAPIFGLFEEQLGHGIIGGRLVSGEAVGREIAALSATLLRGEAPANIPPVVMQPGPATFDWRQLQRWKVDERRLPAGSIVRFRQPSTWERYRWYIVAAVGIILIQAGTILGLLLQRARRRRAEESAYELAGRLITAQEEERRRLARDLHDGLGQDLLVIASQAQLGLAQAENSKATGARLAEIAETARQAVQQARQMAHNLRPGLLEELGLTKALRASADKAARATGLEIEFTLEDMDGLISPEFEVNLFRIFQETLNNILKHAAATRVKVTLRRETSHLRLVVEDNGRGFDAGRLPQSVSEHRGFGLDEIAERVRIMGGRFTVQSRPGKGAQVTVTIPISGEKMRA